MRPDVIVSWPRGCDYPAWRRWITDNRERFGRVWCVLTDHAGPDYSGFLRSLPGFDWLDSPPRDGRDWRDVAVNAALDHSTADRVWFTEQDFEGPIPDGPLVGIDAEDGRPLHPACLMAERRWIDETSRYFGTPPVDHFYTFGTELVTRHEPVYLTGWFHWQATSESQLLLGQGLRPRFRPDQFTDWLTLQLAANVPLDPRWRAMAEAEIAHPRNGRSRVHR